MAIYKKPKKCRTCDNPVIHKYGTAAYCKSCGLIFREVDEKMYRVKALVRDLTKRIKVLEARTNDK